MSIPLEGDPRIRPNRTVSAPARPRRTLSLAPAVLVRIRGAMDRRPRTRDTDTQSTSQVQNESKPSTSTFPDLVLQIIRRGTHGSPGTSNDGPKHIPHVHLEGGKTWEEFNSHATALEKDLQKFQDAVKELGSSLELTGAARNLRKSVSSIARLFQENARKLFPRVVPQSRPPRLTTSYSQRLPRAWPPVANPQIEASYHPDHKPIYDELKAMADGVEYLKRALEQFSEFGDTEDLPLVRFESDLKYWSSCLERYEGQFESRDVQQYIHDLSRELGAQFEDTSLYLREFIDGVPTVRLAQKHFIASLQNIATIATFFSAVTATTLQYSFQKNDNSVSKAVNVFWFSSLIFSIASALNSFLVLTWRRANYSSPRVHIPGWLWIWIRQCPPVFLLISVATFLTGMGCFSFSSRQAHITSVIVIISETISAFGLAALLVWLAYDKWSFHQRQNQLPNFGFARSLGTGPGSVLPTHRKHTSTTNPLESFADEAKPKYDSVLHRTPTETGTIMSLSVEDRKVRARKRWRWVCNEVASLLQTGRNEREQELLESRHMDKTDARLRRLAIFRELSRCEAGTDTRDIQFDPQGKNLAICRDNISLRYELATSKIHECRHKMGQGHQVVWTSSSEHLVTRKSTGFHGVWLPFEGPTPRPHIFRERSRYILGLPTTESNGASSLLSLEGESTLAIVDIKGSERMMHELKGISIQHFDISPDGTRVLIAAEIPYLERDQLAKASRGRKLMVYNLKTSKIEHEIPLWHDVQHVTISVNGRWAVVTYKDFPPPQLWLLRSTHSGVRLSLERQFCARERVSIHEFDPSHHIRFSGRAHFFGCDRYIVCATADGKLHIWRRDKSHPVYINGGLTLDKDKPVQIACSRESNDFMFATRSYDGTVRIWKAHEPPQALPTIRVETTGVSAFDSAPKDVTRLVTLSTLSESPQGSPQSEESSMVAGNAVDPANLAMLLSPQQGPSNQHSGSEGVENNSEHSICHSKLSSTNTLSESPQGSPQNERFGNTITGDQLMGDRQLQG